MGLIAESNLYTPQGSDYESELLKQVDTRGVAPLYLPTDISEDVKGIINAVTWNKECDKSMQSCSYTILWENTIVWLDDFAKLLLYNYTDSCKNNGIAIYFRENIAIIIYDFVKTQLQKYAIL